MSSSSSACEGLLESLLVAEAVPARRSNRLRRLIHRPKRYLIDPALIAVALRLDVQGVMRDGARLYGLGEKIVAAPICALWG